MSDQPNIQNPGNVLFAQGTSQAPSVQLNKLACTSTYDLGVTGGHVETICSYTALPPHAVICQSYFTPGGALVGDSQRVDGNTLRYRRKVDLIIHWINGDTIERGLIERILHGSGVACREYLRYLRSHRRDAEADELQGKSQRNQQQPPSAEPEPTKRRGFWARLFGA